MRLRLLSWAGASPGGDGTYNHGGGGGCKEVFPFLFYFISYVGSCVEGG